MPDILVVLDLKEYRVSPTHLLCQRGDTVEFKSANPSPVIKPYLEVVDLATKQVVFTADSLRQDTPTRFTARSLGRFEYHSEVYPFVKGVMEVVDQEQSGQPSEERPQPGDARCGTHTGDDPQASSKADADLAAVQEQQQQQEQKQQEQGQGQDLGKGVRAEEGVHLGSAQPEAALQLPPRPPPSSLQQQQHERQPSAAGSAGHKGDQQEDWAKKEDSQQEQQEQQHALCAAAAHAAVHERKQNRVSMLGEQVDAEENQRGSAQGGSGRTRRVSFNEHALLQEYLSGRERDLGERLSERPSETNSAVSESSRGRRGSRSRRSSGSMGNTDGEDGGQFHGMNEEAIQHASFAAAAAAAAMPQLTKLALEHKQRRTSGSEGSVLSPFASEANSQAAGFMPRNREAADLGLLTELASQAAVSAICSPRTRGSSRRPSRGASSNGSMTPTQLESSFASGHFRSYPSGSQSGSKRASEPSACGSENDDGSNGSRAITRRRTFHGHNYNLATQGSGELQGGISLMVPSRGSSIRRRSLMSITSSHAGDADMQGFSSDAPKSSDTLSTTAYASPRPPNPTAESHLQHGGPNGGHPTPKGQHNAVGSATTSASPHPPHNPHKPSHPQADGVPQNPGCVMHGAPLSDSNASIDTTSTDSHVQQSVGMYGALTRPHRTSNPSAWGREVTAAAQQQQQHHHHPQPHPHTYPYPPPGKHINHSIPTAQPYSPQVSSSNISSRPDSPAPPLPPPSRPTHQYPTRPSGSGVGPGPHQHQTPYHGAPPSIPMMHHPSAFAAQYQPAPSPFSMSPRASYDSSCRESPQPGAIGGSGRGGGGVHAQEGPYVYPQRAKASQGGHSSSSSTFHSVVSSRRGSQSVQISPGNSMTLAEGIPAVVQAQDTVVPVLPGGRLAHQQHPHQHPPPPPPHNQQRQPHTALHYSKALPYANTSGSALTTDGSNTHTNWLSQTGPPSSSANSPSSSGGFARSGPYAAGTQPAVYSNSQLLQPPPPPPPTPHTQGSASVSRHTSQSGSATHAMQAHASHSGSTVMQQHTSQSGNTVPSTSSTSIAYGVPVAPPASSAFHHCLEGPTRRVSSGPGTMRPPPPPQPAIGTPHAVPAAPVSAVPAVQAAQSLHAPVTAVPALQSTPNVPQQQQQQQLGGHHAGATTHDPNPEKRHAHANSTASTHTPQIPRAPQEDQAQGTAPRVGLVSPAVGSGGSTVQAATATRPSSTGALPRTPCQICNKPYIAALNAKRCAAQHEGVNRVLAKGVPFTDAWAERCKEYGWAELREWWKANPTERTREVFGLLAAVLSGKHVQRGDPSPDTVMKIVQNYRDMRVSIAASTVATYARAGMALMQWMDSRSSGQPPVVFSELCSALKEATEGTAFGLPYGVERSVSLGNKPLSPTANLHVPSCGEACLAYLIELWAGQLMDVHRQQQRVFLEERLTEEAWSGQAMELLLSFDMYKGNTRHVDALFKMMQAPESFLDGMPADTWALQSVGCLVPAPLRVRWEHLVSQTKQQQQQQQQLQQPHAQPSSPDQAPVPPPSTAQATQQNPAPTSTQATTTSTPTAPNNTASNITTPPSAPPATTPAAATAASISVGEGDSKKMTPGASAPSGVSAATNPTPGQPSPHPTSAPSWHAQQQQQHPSSSSTTTTTTNPTNPAPAGKAPAAKSSSQRANHVLAQLAAAPPLLSSRLMHQGGTGSSAKALQARTILPGHPVVGVGHPRAGMPLAVGRLPQGVQQQQQQQQHLRCPVCATKHSSGINLARCEVRHRGGEAASAGNFYMTASGRRFIPGWRGMTSTVGGRTLLPIKEQTQQLAREDMRPRQQHMREALSSQWEQLLASEPHKALKLQGLVQLTGALPSEDLSPLASKWASKWAKVLDWAQNVLLAPAQAPGTAAGSASLMEHIQRARIALGIQRDGTRVSRESNTAETMVQQALVGFNTLWEALLKASGGMCLTSVQFRAEDVYASIHLDSAAGSQVMRGVRGKAGAAETALSVLAVMLELELRRALDADRVVRAQTGSSNATQAPQASPASGTPKDSAATGSSTAAASVSVPAAQADPAAAAAVPVAVASGIQASPPMPPTDSQPAVGPASAVPAAGSSAAGTAAAAAPVVAEGTPVTVTTTTSAAAAAAPSVRTDSGQASMQMAAADHPVLPGVKVDVHSSVQHVKGSAPEVQPASSSPTPTQQQQQQGAPPPIPGLAMRMLASSGSPVPSASELQQQQRQQRRRQQQQQPSKPSSTQGSSWKVHAQEGTEDPAEAGMPSPVKHALNFMHDPMGSMQRGGQQHAVPHPQPGLARHQHHQQQQQQYSSPRHRQQQQQHQQHQQQQQHYPGQASSVGGGAAGVASGAGPQIPPPRMSWGGQGGPPAPGGPHPHPPTPTPLMPHPPMMHPGAQPPLPTPAYPPPPLHHPMHPQPMVSQPPPPPYAAMVPPPQPPPMMPHPQPPHMAASAAAAAGGPMAASMGIPTAPMPYPAPPLSAPMHPAAGVPYSYLPAPMAHAHPSMPPMSPAMYPMPMPSAPLAATPYGPHPMMPMQVPLMHTGMPMQPAAAAPMQPAPMQPPPPHAMMQAAPHPPPPYAMPPSRIAGAPPPHHPAAAMSPTQGATPPPTMPPSGSQPHPHANPAQQHHHHYQQAPWGNNRRAGGPAGGPPSSFGGPNAGANRRSGSGSQVHSHDNRPDSRPLSSSSVGGVGPFLGGPGAGPYARNTHHHNNPGAGSGVPHSFQGGERFSPSYSGAPPMGGQHQRGSRPMSRVPSGGNIVGSTHSAGPAAGRMGGSSSVLDRAPPPSIRPDYSLSPSDGTSSSPPSSHALPSGPPSIHTLPANPPITHTEPGISKPPPHVTTTPPETDASSSSFQATQPSTSAATADESIYSQQPGTWAQMQGQTGPSVSTEAPAAATSFSTSAAVIEAQHAHQAGPTVQTSAQQQQQQRQQQQQLAHQEEQQPQPQQQWREPPLPQQQAPGTAATAAAGTAAATEAPTPASSAPTAEGSHRASDLPGEGLRPKQAPHAQPAVTPQQEQGGLSALLHKAFAGSAQAHAQQQQEQQQQEVQGQEGLSGEKNMYKGELNQRWLAMLVEAEEAEEDKQQPSEPARGSSTTTAATATAATTTQAQPKSRGGSAGGHSRRHPPQAAAGTDAPTIHAGDMPASSRGVSPYAERRSEAQQHAQHAQRAHQRGSGGHHHQQRPPRHNQQQRHSAATASSPTSASQQQQQQQPAQSTPWGAPPHQPHQPQQLQQPQQQQPRSGVSERGTRGGGGSMKGPRGPGGVAGAPPAQHSAPFEGVDRGGNAASRGGGGGGRRGGGHGHGEGKGGRGRGRAGQ